MRLMTRLLAAIMAMAIALPDARAATNKEVAEAIRSAPAGAYVLGYLVVILASILLALGLLKRRNR
ncbi:MAG: hypothetical protein GWP05_08355 [Anaerolineaceae bacterium]|nr:hypothetical protein [Anaerolineaceae bacterium]